MTENQKLKMELLKEFAISDEPKSIEVCREMYKFMVEDEAPTPSVPTNGKHPKDGVYYICDDEKKTIAPYKATLTPPEDAMGVLLVQGERSIIIALRDCNDGEETTLTKQKDPSNLKGNYIDTCIDAVSDWNGQKNTEHLKAVGLSDNISLSDGWYIPSIGEMLFIFTHRKEVNAALEKAGGQPIADDWYWTSTEYSATNAWTLNLNNGGMNTITKATGTYRVRPVSAFIS
ncbi:hypothetical protein CIL02_11280 [Prevotella sp. P3-122]|nr:hypothetical protein CIL02_11280 [Prevotella sp. P3-122]